METYELPQIEVFNRVLKLPVMEMAVAKSATTYNRLKESNRLVNWALSTAESSITTATMQAGPYTKRFETPINFVDRKLCQGLDGIERKVPIVKEQPEMILENAYMMAVQKCQPAVSAMSYANDFVSNQAANAKTVSWNKMNQLLSTHYGAAAVHGFDNTACTIDTLLDKYFPPVGDESIEEEFVISADEDKLLHALQTAGRLSNKAARRVYSNVARKLKTLSRENLRAFLDSLVEFLQLARYLTAINDRMFNGNCCAGSTAAATTKSTATTTTTTTTNGVSKSCANRDVNEASAPSTNEKSE